MTTTRDEYKKIRRQKSFTSIIDAMLTAQNHKCNICSRKLYEYERVPYTHSSYLYEKGMPLYGMARSEVIERSIYEVDHIIPISRGGTNSRQNLQILCRSCNARKGSRVC